MAGAPATAAAADTLGAPPKHETLAEGGGASNVALTPPMGWNSWNQFGCDISEDVIKETAQALVDTGLRDVGYEYVVIDDCWQAPERDADGALQADPVRFPSGIEALADSVHALGLKLGIYGNPGEQSCAQHNRGYPGRTGSLGHVEQDARTFADWGVDYLKYDWCYAQEHGVQRPDAFIEMRDALRATGRDIVYSINAGDQAGVRAGIYADIANLWRTTGDIKPAWQTGSATGLGIVDIIDRQADLAAHAGPGHWNDPDMLEVGVVPGGYTASYPGLTETEARAHFSMWAMMAAPLIAGADIRTIDQNSLVTMSNEEVIAVDQDPAGVQGTRVRDDGDLEVWTKPLADGSVAVALFNRSAAVAQMSTSVLEVGLTQAKTYVARDLWTGEASTTSSALSAAVPAHGVTLLRVEAGTPASGHSLVSTVMSAQSPYVATGETVQVSAEITNQGPNAVQDVATRLQVPAGWSAEEPTQGVDVLPPGETSRVTWTLTAPDGSAVGGQVATVTTTTTARHGNETWQSDGGLALTIVEPMRQDTMLGYAPWLSASNGFGPVERNMSVGGNKGRDGAPLSLAGRTYAQGLGIHAPSSVEYYVGGACTRFTADVGLDDEVADDKVGAETASVVFQVLADGHVVYDSGIARFGVPPIPVSVDLAGVEVLELKVTDAGDGKAADHADWANPVVACGTPFTVDTVLGQAPWVSATNGFGPVERNMSVGQRGPDDGSPLTIEGRTYQHGLGVHAESRVTFDIGGACSRFTSDVGVDDDVANTAASSVVFQVLLDGRLAHESPVMHADTPAHAIDVDITGVDVIELVVTDAGDGKSYDHADWAAVAVACGG